MWHEIVALDAHPPAEGHVFGSRAAREGPGSLPGDRPGPEAGPAPLVDKILKGADPAEIPVEINTKVEFAINLKVAKALGLTIAPEVLYRADRIIR